MSSPFLTLLDQPTGYQMTATRIGAERRFFADDFDVFAMFL